MKAILTTAVLLCASSLAAETPSPEQAEVIAGADAFFAALRSDDKMALGKHMDIGGTIYIHNRMNPSDPRIVVVTVPDHLERWARSSGKVDELMRYTHVLVDGDMAQVWGPYRFISGTSTTHCGINALSMLRAQNGKWIVANTSFTMVAPGQCAALGAPDAPVP
jgi:hypothetical protein